MALLSGDRVGVTRMYAELFPAIHKLVRDYGGPKEEAEDVFQDAVIVVYEKARKPGFQLTSQFSTFFYGVCYNLLMSRRQKKSASEVTISENAKYISDDSSGHRLPPGRAREAFL